MKISLRKGFSFGITTGIITTLGLMIGLYSSTESRLVVIGGIIIIAIADAFADSLGMHISEEAECMHKTKEIWESTFATFFSKFLFTLTFLIPLLFFGLSNAIIISIFWGIFLLSILSFFIAKQQRINPLKVILEHVIITVFVVVITYLLGSFVKGYF